MKKILLFFCSFFICGCQYEIINDYRLEKYADSDVPVCVNYKQRFFVSEEPIYEYDDCGNQVIKPAKYEDTNDKCDVFKPEVVSYSYCLAKMPKPVILVEKKKDDMTICYDRNNKIELPISYCQKDVIVNQSTTVSHTTFVY